MLRKCCLRVVCATFHRMGHGDARRFCHPIFGARKKKRIIRRVYREPKAEPCSQGRAGARGARGLLRGRGGAGSQPGYLGLRGPSWPGPAAAVAALGTARRNPRGGGQ